MGPTASDQDWLEQHLQKMRERPLDMQDPFYAVTLTATDEGRLVIGFQTEWVGYADKDRRIELRQPSLVHARMALAWEDLGQPCVFVRNEDQLSVFMIIGGNALVAPETAESSVYFSRLLKPDHSVRHGRSGFVSPNLAHPQAQRRAPTPKLRMQVLKRDARKCRICGRSPDRNVDIELHVHHILPWESGGITDPENLLTLCHTCHNGLEPHSDPSLFNYIAPKSIAHDANMHRRQVANYRRFAASVSSAVADT